MKKLILSAVFILGFIAISNAQTSATGDVPVNKPKPVTQTTTPENTVKKTTTETDKPAATETNTTTTTKTKKSKKACCKTKSDACCKKKNEAIKED